MLTEEYPVRIQQASDLRVDIKILFGVIALNSDTILNEEIYTLSQDSRKSTRESRKRKAIQFLDNKTQCVDSEEVMRANESFRDKNMSSVPE